MTRLFLLRHAESEGNANNLLQGRTDTDLSDRGVEQAKQVAARLESKDIDAVYCSTLKRSRKTADFVAAPHGIEPEPLTQLQERSFGELEGKTHEDRMELVREQDATLDTVAPTGGETIDDVLDRTVPVLTDLRNTHPDDTVAVIGHGWVNRAILIAALGAESGHASRINQENTCINEIEHDNVRGWRIHRVNDTNHLH